MDEPEEEVVEVQATNKKKKGNKKVVEPDPEELERIRLAEALAKEIAEYGRTWVWEGYYIEEEH